MSLGTSFLSSASLTQSLTIDKFEEIGIKQGYEEGKQLLGAIIKFFRQYIDKVDPQKYSFIGVINTEQEIRIREIKAMSEKFKFYRLNFKEFKHNQSQEVEIYKQAFWLNMLNFMTLFRMAEIIMVKP